MFFFVIMKKIAFKIALLNLNLLSIEGKLMIHSYLLFTLLHRQFTVIPKVDFCIKKYLDKVFLKKELVLKVSKKEKRHCN